MEEANKEENRRVAPYSPGQEKDFPFRKNQQKCVSAFP